MGLTLDLKQINYLINGVVHCSECSDLFWIALKAVPPVRIVDQRHSVTSQVSFDAVLAKNVRTSVEQMLICIFCKFLS